MFSLFQPKDLSTLTKPVGKKFELKIANIDDNYAKMAENVGLKFVQDMAKDIHAIQIIQNIFNALELETYDETEVNDYLNKAIKIERKIRKEPYLSWHWGRIDVYNKIVPANILEKTIRLKNALDLHSNNNKMWYDIEISDYHVPDPDPFISVRFKNIVRHKYRLIYGVWDEPGF